MTLESFAVGDEVAILPEPRSSPEQVLGLGVLALVDEVTVQLTDHRMYSLQHRWGLTPRSFGYFVRATDDHRNALRRK